MATEALKTPPTPESLTAQLGVAKTELNRVKNIQPTVSASELANPLKAPNFTLPPQPTIPSRLGSTVNNVLGSIRSTSDTARKLAEEQATFQTLVGESSGFDIQNEQLRRFGVTPEKLQELEDIQLQLADRATESGVTQTRIAGAAGQTLAQGQREITQEQREEAVRSSGLAARAAVLQGNINAGRQLANDAVNVALQDRTFQANAKIMQINQLKDVVDEETRQLLLKEERGYEAELATIKELKDNVSEAMISGASQAEIATMNDPNTTDEDKLSLAQSVIARNAREEISLDRQTKQANIAQGWANLDLRKQEVDMSRERLNAELGASGNQYGTLDGKAQNATQLLVNGYANRILEADRIIDTVGELFTGRESALGALVPSMFQGPERQQFEQGKRNFINAVLRRESGAVIADNEFKNADKQYFPQPGDTPEVMKQKASNRNTVINNFYAEANVPRPVFAGDIIESDGKKYRVESDGITLTEI